MDPSTLSTYRAKNIEELRYFAPILAQVENRERTAFESNEALIGIDVKSDRPIQAIANKIAQCKPAKLEIKYAQYTERLRKHLRASITETNQNDSDFNFYSVAKTFQGKYLSTALLEMLRLPTTPATFEQIVKKALFQSDNCRWHNYRIDKIKQFIEKPELQKESKKLSVEQLRKLLERHQRDVKRSERDACFSWQDASLLKESGQTTLQTTTSAALSILAGAGVGLATSGLGPSALTLTTLQAASCSTVSATTTGNVVVNFFWSVLAGKPLYIDSNPNDTQLVYLSLSSRIQYAFQVNPSGPIGRYVTPIFSWGTVKKSHTVGWIKLKVGAKEKPPVCFPFNCYPKSLCIQPFEYWRLCQELHKALASGELPPHECQKEILEPLAQGELKPSDSSLTVKKGLIDDCLAILSERLARDCKKLIEKAPPPPEKPKLSYEGDSGVFRSMQDS